MSTPLPPPVLFEGLFDDAAVFPPGSFSLHDAIERRMQRRNSPIAQYVGPLLLPIALLAQALSDTSPLTISVVGRPGTPTADLIAAAGTVADARGHSLAGIELPYEPQWHEARSLGVPLAVEVPAGAAGLAALDGIDSGDQQVRAKLRTGSTPTVHVPSARDLAAFIDACVTRGLSFKLTGGLHHPVTGNVDLSGQTEFGFVNVLLATHAAIEGGTLDDLVAILHERRTEPLVARLRALSAPQAHAIREAFHSYGCCNVLDPINALTDLDLIKETTDG